MSDHVHRFLPFPVGADGRDRHESPHPQRFANRCAECGHWQNPRPLALGPDCTACGLPTVLAVVDPDAPLHPCCAEPELMALGRATARRTA